MKVALSGEQKSLTPEMLFELWSQGKLSVEEVLRHLIQNSAKQEQAIDVLNITAKNLRSDVDDLIAQCGIKPKLKN